MILITLYQYSIILLDVQYMLLWDMPYLSDIWLETINKQTKESLCGWAIHHDHVSVPLNVFYFNISM